MYIYIIMYRYYIYLIKINKKNKKYFIVMCVTQTSCIKKEVIFAFYVYLYMYIPGNGKYELYEFIMIVQYVSGKREL